MATGTPAGIERDTARHGEAQAHTADRCVTFVAQVVTIYSAIELTGSRHFVAALNEETLSERESLLCNYKLFLPF